jgi:arylsulfatase A-like enzyme
MWHVVFALSIAICIGGCGGESPSPGKGRPPGRLNIVFVLSDALRAASMPMYGYPRDTTPNLQEIARSSIVFDDHLSNAPNTIVSVSQLFSGRLMTPILLGAQHRVALTKAIPSDLMLLPQVLGELGYRTAIVAAHSWFNQQARILEHFEVQQTPDSEAKSPYPQFEEMLPAVREIIAEAAAGDRPFFLYIHAMDTHAPFRFHPGFDRYRGVEDWPAKYNVYDSEIMYVDHCTQQVYAALQEHGVLDRTIFVFTSDHGEEFNEMGPGWPNRTHGYSARRALHHVPLIIRLPGDPNPGKRYPRRTQHLDLAPTLARLAVPEIDLQEYRIDGRDLSDELYGGASRAEEIETSISRGMRYWGFYRRKEEAHYDHWSDEIRFYEIQSDRFNYPRPVSIEGTSPFAEHEGEMRREYERRNDEFWRLPRNEGLLGALDLTVSPFSVAPSSEGAPTYAESEADGRWHLRPWTSLSAGPSEEPGPIRMAMPWAAERYRVWVRLDEELIEKGYRNGFRVEIAAKQDRVVEVEEAGPERGVLVDLGEHDLDGRFEASIAEPRGGVGISGFKLEYLGEERATEAIADDEQLKSRLRALGYVE